MPLLAEAYVSALPCGLIAFILIALYALRQRSSKDKLPLPPMPKSTWLIGKTREALDPNKKIWTYLQEWKEETGAGDIMMVPTLNQYNLFINTAQAAQDLLEKKGHIYAARPKAVWINEMVNKEMILVIMSNQEKVKRLRKLMHEQFNAQAMPQFYEAQSDECASLLHSLLLNPSSSDECYKTSMRALVLRTTYGRAISYTSEELWAHVEHAGERPKPVIADFLSLYPWLGKWPRWLPGGGFHDLAERYYKEDEAIWSKVRDDVKLGLEKGTVQSCILSRMYASDAPKRLGFSELEMAFTVANLFTAGGDLPEVILRIFTCAALHFPETMAIAKSEIDRVVGRDRLPNFEDKNDLPYTRALILEVLRWRTLAPIGVSHATLEDDVYQGFFIPKGTVVFPNLHAMSRDPDVYPEPEAFRPERFLSADGKSVTRKNELPTFGWGRRSCSAMHLAEGTLYLFITSILWAFNIEAPMDSEGQRILPSSDVNEWISVLPCFPPEFDATFVPRDGEVKRVVNEYRAASGLS